MRILKLASSMILVLVFGAVATATASAAETLWIWLPGAAGTKFTGKSRQATLQIKGSGTITCKESSAEGEITNESTLGLATIDFGANCTAGLLPANSLGDASGIILAHVEIHNCKIPGGGDGLLIKVLPVHIEVPSTKLLILVEGSLVVSINPTDKAAKAFNLVIQQTGGQQTIESCEGGPKGGYTLTASLDGGTPKQAAEEVTEPTITWTSVEQEAML